jgi:regulator of CtrA degradation
MAATVEFFDRTMMEAMALLAETRRYLGEMNLIEATRPDRRLGGRDLCLNTQGDDDPGMPEELRNLLARSLSLYRRIARLDEQAAERAADQLRQTELTYPAKIEP